MLLTLLFCLSFLQPQAFGQTPAISFSDVTTASGISVPQVSTPENRYIVESMSGGVAVFDCDGDGFLDVATVNGSSVERYKNGGDLFLTLYRQVEGATSRTPKFENITASAGLDRKGWGMGITAADFDNDGIPDLFVTGFGRSVAYRGLGQCRFVDVSEKTNLKGSGFMTGSAWADFDRDGDIDVFVARYVSLELDNLPIFGSSPTCSYKGIRVQCGPRGLPGESDLFFRNKGDGTFEEVAKTVGVDDAQKFFGLGVTWGDYDNDGWLDLYVANDSGPNYLYRNNRNGTFSDVSFETGTSYSGSGGEQGSMGVAWGDYDNDGFVDLFVTNFENEHNTLYKNLGPKGFLDASMETKLGSPSMPYVGWGTAFVDFDNDGLLDLFVANGHVYPQMDLVQGNGFRQHFLLHRNLGNGTFEEISGEAGLRAIPFQSRRGAAFGDLNNDGRIDVVVTSLGATPAVLLNTTANKNRWLTIKLNQQKPNGDAIGSRAILKTNKRTMLRDVEAGSSYLSQNDFRLHFGFGVDEKIESLEIRWASGERESFFDIPTGKFLTITKGKGITKVEEPRSR